MSVAEALKRFVKAAAAKAGFEIRRAGAEEEWDPEPYRRRARLMAAHDIDLVLDVGAHEGNYARWLRHVGYAGKIASFEPQGSAFEKLVAASADDPLWECRRVALGERPGELEMNISEATVGSSLLPLNPRLLDSHPALRYVDRERVPVERLDSVGPGLNGQRAYLKLDVQGYERQVLAGAGELLQGLEAIEVELSMVPLYEGAPLLREVVDFLGERGFELVFVEPVHDEPSTGYTLQVDGVFVSRLAATRPAGAAEPAL